MVVDTEAIQAADTVADMVDKRKLSKSFAKAQEVTEVMEVGLNSAHKNLCKVIISEVVDEMKKESTL